jgi:hypothetical protein
VRIEIVKDDDQQVVDHQENDKGAILKKGKIPQSRIKYKGQHQETDPCGDMNGDLYE